MWPFSKPTPDLTKATELAGGRRLLEMVAVLHSRGLQGLRIAPHLAPSGSCWRCYLLPKARMESFFQYAPSFFELEPRAMYSTGQWWEPFGWKGVQARSASQWADRFLQEFPQTCKESSLSDPDYVEWFRRMLKESGDLLIYAWDDYSQHDPPVMWPGNYHP